MHYTELGRTGLKVSRLGFGAMRLPMVGDGENARVNRDLAIPMIHRAFEAGVNYIDTAIMYCNRDSQRAVGEALKGWRDKVVVSTKNHFYCEDEREWWQHLEDSLERLQVDCIDLYNNHGIRWKRYVEHVEPRIGKWMQKAKDQGLIKHICISFHDTNEALMKVIDAGYAEVITLQYNVINRQLEKGIAYAHEQGIGVVVMGPVGGGRLGEPSEVLKSVVPGVKRVPELALRFVLSNPHVNIALSGMSTIEQVEENIGIASDPVTLSENDKEVLTGRLDQLSKIADLYCTGCEYCMPCPIGVDIPEVFDLYNKGRVYGLWGFARARYGQMLKTQRENHLTADACIQCGTCEEKCPQDIPIRKQLKKAHEALTQL